MSPFRRFFDLVRNPSNSRTVGILALFVIALAIPLTVNIAQRQQELRQHASDTCIASDPCTGWTYASCDDPATGVVGGHKASCGGNTDETCYPGPAPDLSTCAANSAQCSLAAGTCSSGSTCGFGQTPVAVSCGSGQVCCRASNSDAACNAAFGTCIAGGCTNGQVALPVSCGTSGATCCKPADDATCKAAGGTCGGSCTNGTPLSVSCGSVGGTCCKPATVAPTAAPAQTAAPAVAACPNSGYPTNLSATNPLWGGTCTYPEKKWVSAPTGTNKCFYVSCERFNSGPTCWFNSGIATPTDCPSSISCPSGQVQCASPYIGYAFGNGYHTCINTSGQTATPTSCSGSPAAPAGSLSCPTGQAGVCPSTTVAYVPNPLGNGNWNCLHPSGGASVAPTSCAASGASAVPTNNSISCPSGQVQCASPYIPQGLGTNLWTCVNTAGLRTLPTTCNGTAASAAPAVSSNPAPAGGVQLAFVIGLDGVGSTGDQLNRGNASASNQNPLNKKTRALTYQVFDNTNSVVASLNNVTTQLTFADGKFRGTTGITLASGTYFVKANLDGALVKKSNAIVVTGNQTITIALDLINGDINGNNRMEVLDYNILAACWPGINTTNASTCSDPAFRTRSDLNDDGAINQFDYNLFLREFSIQQGD